MIAVVSTDRPGSTEEMELQGDVPQRQRTIDEIRALFTSAEFTMDGSTFVALAAAAASIRLIVSSARAFTGWARVSIFVRGVELRRFDADQ